IDSPTLVFSTEPPATCQATIVGDKEEPKFEFEKQEDTDINQTDTKLTATDSTPQEISTTSPAQEQTSNEPTTESVKANTEVAEELPVPAFSRPPKEQKMRVYDELSTVNPEEILLRALETDKGA